MLFTQVCLKTKLSCLYFKIILVSLRQCQRHFANGASVTLMKKSRRKRTIRMRKINNGQVQEWHVECTRVREVCLLMSLQLNYETFMTGDISTALVFRSTRKVQSACKPEFVLL